MKQSIVFLSKQAMVIGPTPPGTGVKALAFFETSSNATSPTIPLAVLLIPTPFIFEATAYTYVLCAVGGILLFNALVGVCVIYGIFGVNTCENS